MIVKLLDSYNCALMSEHKSSIRRKYIHPPLARHFVDAKHYVSDLKFCGIQNIFKIAVVVMSRVTNVLIIILFSIITYDV